MTAWDELEEVKVVVTAYLKAGEVVEGLLHAAVGLLDDKGAVAEDVVATMGLDPAGTDRRVSSWR